MKNEYRIKTMTEVTDDLIEAKTAVLYDLTISSAATNRILMSINALIDMINIEVGRLKK